MLRRSPRFKPQAYSTIIPAEDDYGEVLDQKWGQWVESESFKRYWLIPNAPSGHVELLTEQTYLSLVHPRHPSFSAFFYQPIDSPFGTTHRSSIFTKTMGCKDCYAVEISLSPEHVHSIKATTIAHPNSTGCFNSQSISRSDRLSPCGISLRTWHVQYRYGL